MSTMINAVCAGWTSSASSVKTDLPAISIILSPRTASHRCFAIASITAG
jgi:hypothetical protein